MSNVSSGKKTRSLEQRYVMLRKTLAHYLLLQVGTFVKAAGFEAIGPAMGILTDKKAEMKVAEILEEGKGESGDALLALSQNLADSMGETFDSDYEIETRDSSRTVRLNRCGCIESVVAHSEDYGLSQAQARSIFCGTCMSSYRKASEGVSLGFKGRLSKEGCMMSFSKK